MKSGTKYLTVQYKFVCGARNVLLDYCWRLSSSDLINENPSFGRGGSIRNLLVHMANTYEFWILNHSLKKNIAYSEYLSITKVSQLKVLFQEIDMAMEEFFLRYGPRMEEPFTIVINGKEKKVSALELFTHVITHEFHHKGQILSLSRHLGHIPVDTDIIR